MNRRRSYCGRPTGGGSICPVCIQLFQGPRLDELRDAVTTVVETYRRNENAIATLDSPVARRLP